jgi:hypothetical protein
MKLTPAVSGAGRLPLTPGCFAKLLEDLQARVKAVSQAVPFLTPT